MNNTEQIEAELTASNPIVEQSLEYKMAILAEKDISENVTKACTTPNLFNLNN